MPVVAVGILCAAGLIGCGAGAKPPSPAIEPIGRLGRWNGTTFAPVAPASVTSGHLYVLVHGWAAGFKKAVDDYPGPGPLLGWYPQAVKANGEPFIQIWLAPMAAALSSLDPGATILAFSWLDQSATDDNPLAARISEEHTGPNGKRLGQALNQAIDPAFADHGGMTHVLGHSHGSKVATIGSLAMRRPPDHLTLMDSVDTVLPALIGADNDLVPYLRRLPIGRRPGTTFVDNYFSEFGRAYGNEAGLGAIVDVSLVPAQYPRAEAQARHLYPPRWYTDAAEHPQTGVGPQWSPLVGTASEHLASYYVEVHPGDVARQLELKPAARPPRPTPKTFVEHWWIELLAAFLVAVMAGALVVTGAARWRSRRRLKRAR